MLVEGGKKVEVKIGDGRREREKGEREGKGRRER